MSRLENIIGPRMAPRVGVEVGYRDLSINRQ